MTISVFIVSLNLPPSTLISEVGASYTVYERNWACPKCKFDNYASRPKCSRCRASKPEGTEQVIPSSLPSAAGSDGLSPSTLPDTWHAWRETVDASTQQLYYYHTQTGETRWDRPAEMGEAPMASGWYGRGAAGQGAARYLEANERYLKRPARKQKACLEAGRSVLEGANEYNIWYGKYTGEHWRQGRGREPAETRCVLSLDAGRTRADSVDANSRFFCIHFARGACARGADCLYFHRIPTVKEDAAAGELHDCFGRERHVGHRDDMDGVGSFTRPSRTLYVGGILKAAYADQREVEAVVREQFGEWGEVEHVNFVPRISAAFVR